MTSLRILVVEDHPSTNDALAALLRKQQHAVTSTFTAREALEAVKGKHFDLAIVDIGLPDDNGWNLVVKLRRSLPRLPAIALTGFGYESDLHRSAIVGFAAHLTKPIEFSRLEAEIARVFPASVKRPSQTGP